MITFGVWESSRLAPFSSWRVASMPSRLGIRTSINTTSAWVEPSRSRAAKPSVACPATVMSGWASITIARPATTSC